jgi:hypothetical protein
VLNGPSGEPNGDDYDVILGTVALPVGDSAGSAHLTFELMGDRGPPPEPNTAVTRLITAWIDVSGPVLLSGPASGQLTLHQQLPYGTLSLGPVRATNTGVGNVVLYVRSTVIGSAGPTPGHLVIKAATSVLGATSAKPLATGLIAR